MTIFIAGQVTGAKNYKQAFDEAEEFLTKRGHVVLNPSNLPKGLHYEEYFLITYPMIQVSDAIFALPSSKYSKGALREIEHGVSLGLKILTMEDFNDETEEDATSFIGYKNLDKHFIYNSFLFKLGETYDCNTEIEFGVSGFHFRESLYQSILIRNLILPGVIVKVQVFEPYITTLGGAGVARKIKILEEVSEEEIERTISEVHWQAKDAICTCGLC